MTVGTTPGAPRRRSRSGWQSAAFALLFLGLVAFSQSPLARAGFTGGDFRLLAVSEGPPWTQDAAHLAQIGDGSLPAGASLSLSGALWGAGPVRDAAGVADAGAARGWRLENLALLLLAAAGLMPFVERLLLPWVGGSHARAAALAAAALFALHPLNVFAVAGLGSRGVLLAAAVATWSASSFLSGRQERHMPRVVLAGVGTLLVGLDGDGAFFLPLLFCLAELFSSHRYRQNKERLRTTGTTLLVFGSAALFGAWLRDLLTGGGVGADVGASLAALTTPGGLGVALSRSSLELGLLFLPTGVHAAGAARVALAGALFLVAVQPALVAARSAPRLWGWLLSTWLAAIALALLPLAIDSIGPTDLTRAGALPAAVAVTCAGLGLASTALSGARRVLLPGLVALGYAVLAHANASPFAQASVVAAELRADVDAARLLHGRDGLLVVVDAPTIVLGLDALGEPLDWLLGTGLDSEAPVRTTSLAGFTALTREREFARLREAPVLVVLPAESLSGGGAPRLPREGTLRAAVRLGAPRQGRAPRSWGGGPRSPDLDVEPLPAWGVGDWLPDAGIEGLRVTLRPGGAPGGAPAGALPDQADGRGTEGRGVAWRGRDPGLREGRATGVWLPGGEAPVLYFDLATSPDWRLSTRVQRVWLESGLPNVARAELLEFAPDLGPAVTPAPDAGDWRFARPTADVVTRTAGQGRFTVCLLDLETWEYLEIPCEPDGPQHLRATGAADRVARAVRESSGRGAVAWTLDYRVDGVTVARARGRRVGRLGSREE